MKHGFDARLGSRILFIVILRILEPAFYGCRGYSQKTCFLHFKPFFYVRWLFYYFFSFPVNHAIYIHCFFADYDYAYLFLGEEETVEPEPKPAEPARVGAYVPIHLRVGGARLGPIQAQPNLESTEEFPTLDAAASQEKPKKNKPEAQEVHDNSWTEGSQGHRMSDSNFRSSGVPAHLRRGDDDAPTKYSSQSSYRENLARRVGDIPTRDAAPARSSWVRGDVNRTAVRPSEPAPAPRASGWARGATIG